MGDQRETAVSLGLHGVSRRFGHVLAVDDVDLAIESGQTLALLGPSGCGKSTLLRLVAGLERPDSGRVTLDGADITGLPPQKRNMGMVFQSYALFPHLNVAQNVAFGLVENGVQPEPRKRRVSELLRLVGLAGMESRRVDKLSGGQQQRVALARALAPDPDTLLLDEPLSNLDEQLRQSLKDELGKLLGTLGKRAVYVTHDQTEAFTLADRVALMNAGRIVQLGTSAELLENPVSGWAARFLGHENVYPAGSGVSAPGVDGRHGSLFRADLARLFLPDPTQGAGPPDHVPFGWPWAKAVVTHAAREGLAWRLELAVAAWNTTVTWRGFERELPAALAPQPGLALVIAAPMTAWRRLPTGEPATTLQDHSPSEEQEHHDTDT